MADKGYSARRRPGSDTGSGRNGTGVDTTIDVVVCPKSRNVSRIPSRPSIDWACTLRWKQSSPVIRWHSTTCGVSRAALATFGNWPGHRGDADESGDRHAERGGVPVHPVTGDDAEPLQALHPFGDGRSGHPDAAGQLRHRQARVVGEFGEETHIDRVRLPRKWL